MNAAALLLASAFITPPLEEPLTPEQLAAEVETLVRELADRDQFSGAVLVARGDEVLVQLAVGEASKRFHVPNRVDTKFNLGSMNKMFTGVAIAQLCEESLLSYDMLLSEYVDETWLPSEITARVTLQHLLNHTSGLGSYFNETYMESSRERFRDVGDFRPLVQGEHLAFEPGQGWAYSNTGFLMLGVVIEESTGASYDAYVQKNVYEAAGMEDSGCFEMDLPVENLAIGYDPDPEVAGGWRNNLYMHVIKGGPAGGGFSTVGDLHRFARALQTGKLLGKASMEHLWTRQERRSYGCGFSISQGPMGKVVGHSGGFPGISSNLDIYLDSDYVVAVMSNYSSGLGAVEGPLRQLVERAAD